MKTMRAMHDARSITDGLSTCIYGVFPGLYEGREDEERNRTKSKFAQGVAYGLLASKAGKEIRRYSTHLHISRERHARGEWWARGWKRDWRMQSTTDASASVDQFERLTEIQFINALLEIVS